MAKFWEPTDEELQKIESLAARGMEQQDIALCLGIHPCTLSEKKGCIDKLAKAIKRGKAKGIARVTNALLKNIDNGNVTAQIFYLKTQAKWKEDNNIIINATLSEGTQRAVKNAERQYEKPND